MIATLWRREQARRGWLGDPPARGVLAPSEAEPEQTQFFVRERDGRLSMRASGVMLAFFFAAIAEPLWDLLTDGDLSGWAKYERKAVVGLIGMVATAGYEFWKLKHAD